MKGINGRFAYFQAVVAEGGVDGEEEERPAKKQKINTKVFFLVFVSPSDAAHPLL